MLLDYNNKKNVMHNSTMLLYLTRMKFCNYNDRKNIKYTPLFLFEEQYCES